MRTIAILASAVALAACTPGQSAPDAVATSGDLVAGESQSATDDSDATAERCAVDHVQVALGRSGAWHGMTAQNVTLRNVSPQRCVLDASVVRAVLLVGPRGRTVTTDLAPVEGRRLVLGHDRAASLSLGADGSSGHCGPIARSVEVRLGGIVATVRLRGA